MYILLVYERELKTTNNKYNNNNNDNDNNNNNNNADDDDYHNDNILLFVRREVAFKYDLMRSNKKYKIIRKIS